jgi:hypothetical protein
MKRLRDYAWHDRIGLVLLAVALVGASILRSQGVV